MRNDENHEKWRKKKLVENAYNKRKNAQLFWKNIQNNLSYSGTDVYSYDKAAARDIDPVGQPRRILCFPLPEDLSKMTDDGK